MPKDNRDRASSHYSYSSSKEHDRERPRDRSPRDRDRDRDRDRERYRDRSEQGYSYRYREQDPYQAGSSYTSDYSRPPSSSSHYDQPSPMSERKGGFARGRGGNESRKPPPQYPPRREESREQYSQQGTSYARGGPSAQPGYQRAPSTPGAGRSVSIPEAKPSSSTEEGRKEKAAAVGRGSWRGGRILPAELLVTRDKDLKNKKGTSGQAVRLQSNYFKLLSRPDWCLFQYAVKYEPDIDRSSVRKGLLRQHKDALRAYIFDGSTLYTSDKYASEVQEFVGQKQNDNETVRITVQFAREISKSDYQYLQFFNILMRKCYEQLKLQLVGRNYFDPLNKVVIPQYRLELWPGYITSIRQHERDILMNAEITHKVMRQQTLLDILNDLYRRCGDNFKRAYAESVIGLVVLTDYNNNTYRIDDVDFDVTPLSTFTKKDGSTVTFQAYYRDKYQISVRVNSQPLLVTKVKPKDRRGESDRLVYLVPELCRATGITDDMRKNYQLMNAMAQNTRVSPSVRIRELLNFNKRLYSKPEIISEFERWNLKLDRQLVDVPGRILEDESIFIGKGLNIKGTNAEWTKEFRSQEMFAQCPLREWFILYPRQASRDIGTFIGNMIKVGNGFRLQIVPPTQVELRDDKANDYASEIENIMSRQMPQLICCVVANNRSDRYSAIKKKCAVDRPVPSQVILSKNLTKGGMSIATKVAIQVNCKLGGAPWTVRIPLEGLMVIGFDVSHDTNRKGRDFGAMVASLDKYCTRYYSTVSSHSSGEELSNFFATNLIKALRKYEEINKSRPNRIIIYRDSVGEGDVAYVVEHEVGAIKRALNEAYGDPNLVKFAFILVVKRINTRLFFNNSNPPPGTVVDDVITNPLKFDFYLISQYVKEGTVSPTGYSVLHNTCGLDPDKIQRLTFKLTHMYYNWCGTVRVPAPCQYAHKLAFLVAQAIHKEPHAALDSILHFL